MSCALESTVNAPIIIIIINLIIITSRWFWRYHRLSENDSFIYLFIYLTKSKIRQTHASVQISLFRYLSSLIGFYFLFFLSFFLSFFLRYYLAFFLPSFLPLFLSCLLFLFFSHSICLLTGFHYFSLSLSVSVSHSFSLSFIRVCVCVYVCWFSLLNTHAFLPIVLFTSSPLSHWKLTFFLINLLFPPSSLTSSSSSSSFFFFFFFFLFY